MKINGMLYRIILLLLAIIVSSACMSTLYVEASDGLPSFGEEYRPQIDVSSGSSGTSATSIISKILGVLSVIGVALIVVSIGLIGFNTILGSASEKAASQGKYVGLLIAAALLTGGTAIAKMIISVAETL